MKDLLENNSEFNNLKGILLKGIDSYDIIDIIGNEDYSAAFGSYKLMNISNFVGDIDKKILTTYNENFVNREFIYSMKNLSSNLHSLKIYLFDNTEISDDGRVIKAKKDKVLDLKYLYELREGIANEIKKYIQ